MPTKEELETEILEQKEEILRLEKQFKDGSNEYEQAMNEVSALNAQVDVFKTHKELTDQKLKATLRQLSDYGAEIEALKDVSVDALQTITQQHTKIVQMEHIIQKGMKPVHRT